MDDASLVREFQRTGDHAPFNALVGRHREAVFRLILSILGPGREGAAEELAQEVFLKAFRKLDQFRGKARFSSWLYRIAYNQALDHRSRARFRTPQVEPSVLEATPSADPDDDPAARLAQARAASAVDGCLADLPHPYRSALYLFYWLDMTVPEIGATLGAPDGTVKSYLHRGRARLHQLLTEKGISHV